MRPMECSSQSHLEYTSFTATFLYHITNALPIDSEWVSAEKMSSGYSAHYEELEENHLAKNLGKELYVHAG
jgi:hypothetical protein